MKVLLVNPEFSDTYWSFVRIVKRCPAAYQFPLRERPECRQALIEILDTFVAAGWPEAFELTYQLEEIYR
jgi:hypothetical protein